MYSFLVPNIFRDGQPHFYGRLLAQFTFLPFGKVWLSSICWPRCAKSGNEAECRIYGGWV